MEHPSSMFMDDVKIPEDTLKQLESADILITYVLHLISHWRLWNSFMIKLHGLL